VLIVESTDAAYVSSRPPGCTLALARHDNVPVADYRFVVAAASPGTSSSSWRRGLLRRLDSSVSALLHAAVVKRLYYKWWTSTDCLAHFTDPDAWTPAAAVDRDAEDVVVQETADDDRIFLRSPLSAHPRRRPVSDYENALQTNQQAKNFYPRDAVLERVQAIAPCLSVCLSVCHKSVFYQNG